jgi:hypothetical protein
MCYAAPGHPDQWAQRLKRVFNIDKVNCCVASREGALGYIETCSECGGDVRIIASNEDPAVINKILAHLDEKAATTRLPPCRAPPVTD